jgi:exodeoxyribonuclease VII large subunit
VAASRTPVVSAIGHESDQPLLDLVADVAASTPTDAAKLIVPNLAAELRALHELRERARSAIRRRLTTEVQLTSTLPLRLRRAVRAQLDQAQRDVQMHRDHARRRMTALVSAASSELDHLIARTRALSPQSTLQRGYAVVQRADGTVVRAPTQAVGRLWVRVAHGEFHAVRVDT